jgi:uncharacterized protein (TIGR03435 family)
MRLHAVAAMLAIAGAAVAQDRPAFDVAVIKPNVSGELRQTILLEPGGRLVDRNVTLTDLIYQAYGLRFDGQLRGAPSWAARDRFDVDAKAEGAAGMDRAQLMLQGLLAERFGLAVHRETGSVQVFVLKVVDRSKLKAASPGDCEPPPKGICGGFRAGPGKFTGRAVSMERLARFLSGPRTGRLVTDATGLSGAFDLMLEWTPDAGPTAAGFDAAALDPNGPSIFTALREQLGLTLESTTGSMDVVVIDQVHKPTEN